jgi:tetratricopeptide (TPR) repeat protein
VGANLGAYKYKAFISYSHQDKTWANWLHKRLETYPVPKRIIGNETTKGIVPRRLTPIFRDREELEAAGSLSDKIQAALVSSENMVVLCSPRSAKSHWVNQEILQYKRLHPDGDIFSVIADGEPFASGMPGREDEECFPSALRFEIGKDGELTDKPAEPLAADLRPQGDGKRMGSLKLVAGMIGVGLDELIQRDLQRARKRVMAVTTTSFAGMLIMATLTGFALAARKEADARRNDAEGLIEFMLTDLRAKLEPVGRLDALETVGNRAVEYYDAQDINKMSNDALGRQARVFHYLGEIDKKQGNMDVAVERWQSSYETTKALLERNPNDPQRIYDHAQSAFWVGYGYQRKNWDYATTGKYYREYSNLANRLIVIDPENIVWQAEVGYAHSNLGHIHLANSEPEIAVLEYEKSNEVFLKIVERTPGEIGPQLELAKGYGDLANAHKQVSSLATIIGFYEKQNLILSSILEQSPNDMRTRYSRNAINYQLIELFLLQGKKQTVFLMSEKRTKENRFFSSNDETNVEFRNMLAWGHAQQASLHLSFDEIDEARLELQKAVTVHEEILKNGESSKYFFITNQIQSVLIDAEIDFKQEKYESAWTKVSRVLGYPPDQVELDLHSITSNYIDALLLAGKIQAAKGNEEKANQYWREILSFDPKTKSLSSPVNRLLFYEVYLLLGMEEAAAKQRNLLTGLGVADRFLKLERQ